MIFAVMGSERWMKMEELNGYTPPASLNLSDFQDAIGDAVVQAIIKIGIRVNREELLKALKYDRGSTRRGMMQASQTGSLKRSMSSAVGTASTGRETKTLCVCCILSLTQMPEVTRARLFAWK